MALLNRSIIVDLIECGENGLRTGQLRSFEAQLEKIPLRKVPRPFVHPLANLLRRASKPHMALRLLTPIVHADQINIEPSDLELVEYATCLQKIGLPEEADAMLMKINPEQTPSALMGRVHCLFSQWKYQEALPIIRHYLELNKFDNPYHKAIGEINLIAALVVSQQFEQAKTQLQAMKKTCSENGWQRLLANSYELHAQVHIHEGQYFAAEKALNEAKVILTSTGLREMLFVDKWIAIIKARSKQDPAPLKELRKLAIQEKHYETVRAVDLEILKITESEELKLHLYYGSPFDYFKNRILSEYGAIESHYDWHGPAKRCLDLRSGQENQKQILNPGKKIHQVFFELSQDFYRPLQLGTLFSRIFKDEFFNVFTSPNRVQKLVSRTRVWLSENNIPVTINEAAGAYELRFHAPYAIRRNVETPHFNSIEINLASLKDQIGEKSFSSAEVSEFLSTSPSTALRLLQDGVAHGVVQKAGSGRWTKYRFSA